MRNLVTRTEKRARRRVSIHARIRGSAECPRLVVFRSLKAINAQLVDDDARKTLASAGAKDVDAKSKDVGERAGKTALAYLTGKKLAEKATALKISKIVFDRAGYKYHGRVRALAEGARDGGLKF